MLLYVARTLDSPALPSSLFPPLEQAAYKALPDSNVPPADSAAGSAMNSVLGRHASAMVETLATFIANDQVSERRVSSRQDIR